VVFGGAGVVLKYCLIGVAQYILLQLLTVELGLIQKMTFSSGWQYDIHFFSFLASRFSC